MASTQNASLVEAALQTLKFEELPHAPGVMGEPPKFKVTHETIRFLRLDRNITVNNDGSVTVK